MFVKVCSQCGSTDVSIPPAGMDLRMTIPDYCTKCGNRGVFPEIDKEKVKDFQKKLEEVK